MNKKNEGLTLLWTLCKWTFMNIYYDYWSDVVADISLDHYFLGFHWNGLVTD